MSESVFTDLLSQAGLPEAATAKIRAKLDEAYNLIQENNVRILRIQASKAQDPNNEEYLDSLWRANRSNDPKIVARAARFDAVSEEYEKLLKELREAAKAQVKPPLSEEEQRNQRKLVNESVEAVNKAKQAAATVAEIADQMLEIRGKAIEGGIMSLMPQIESLKQTRGRKSADGEKRQYMTRADEILVDGKSTNKMDGDKSKGSFNYAAEALSREFGSARIASNAVTAIEIEEEYFKAMGLEFRDKESPFPDPFEFTFTKTIKKQNPNDDKFTEAPVSKKITVIRKKTETSETTEGVKPEVKSETKTSAPGPETQKLIDAKKQQENAKAASAKK